MVQFCYLKLYCLSVLQWMARNWARVLKLEKVRRTCKSNNLLTTLYSSPFFHDGANSFVDFTGIHFLDKWA